jgi:hypothetical protein
VVGISRPSIPPHREHHHQQHRFRSTVTWFAMKGRTAGHWKAILVLGLVVEALYIAVLAVSSQHLSRTRNLLAFVFTALQLVETFAYLLIVWYYPHCGRGALPKFSA